MPRKARIISSTGIYHVTLRSINQHIIFEEDSDYQKFLFLLANCKSKFDIDIYAYCLMDNHIHLLLYSSDEHLASFFKSLESRFARWYNIKYSRFGHLFQERFHSFPIEDDSYFLSTLSYIHNNPVRAEACLYASEYRWSSFNAFYGQKNPLVNVSYSYKIAGSKDSLLKYFSTCSESHLPYSINDTIQRYRISDDAALRLFKNVTGLSSTSEVVLLPKKIRNDYIRLLYKECLTQPQIARLMDVSTTTVKRICKL